MHNKPPRALRSLIKHNDKHNYKHNDKHNKQNKPPRALRSLRGLSEEYVVGMPTMYEKNVIDRCRFFVMCFRFVWGEGSA